MRRTRSLPVISRFAAAVVAITVLVFTAFCTPLASADFAELENAFRQPPESARPWVYWFWMDGNLNREGMSADLEAMRKAGIGGMIIMEVDVGIPRGPVKFMSPEWRELFKHAAAEAERLGLEITLNAGPGWTGSGGPWVRPEQSMQHLVASTVQAAGPAEFDSVLPRPEPRDPHFVHAPIPAQLQEARKSFYRDVAVIAFPTPAKGARIADSDEKALYYRNPYSSHPGVKAYLPTPPEYPAIPAGSAIACDEVVDLTERLSPDGRLTWKMPAGNWTIMRFGRTSTGANTRPAPAPGIGFESDKFDPAALEAHWDEFVKPLLALTGGRSAISGPEKGSGTFCRNGPTGASHKRFLTPFPAPPRAGWTMLHIDSWEMGAQNWTARFRDEFRRRRGYDPLPYLPAMLGRVVESLELSERFLWDVRQTAQELVVENHAEHLKELGRRHGLGLSIEPYDMNPCADLSLGGVADVPMCEFWAHGFGFETSFSCIEAVSIAHTRGRPIVAAESFTSDDKEAWRLHPGAIKAQADWAFCMGINRIVFHRYAHQPWLDRFPGMTMGPYGVHYERTQTWWDLVPAWHTYLARCQHLLRQGLPVADICYLAPEGAPFVFKPPADATRSLAGGAMPDRLGYNFDACAPETLLAGTGVKDGRLVLPDGMRYRVLVLPQTPMTPALLRKVKELAEAGATVIGSPPRRSPSLANYPKCDEEVTRLAGEMWGNGEPFGELAERACGKGRVIRAAGPAEIDQYVWDTLTPLAKAKWIWHKEGSLATDAPVGARYFRRVLVLEGNRRIKSARALMTADNSFELRVNGHPAGTGNNFNSAISIDVKTFLRPGANVIAVAAKNGGDRPNPAGLIGLLQVKFDDGERIELNTDASWRSASATSTNWASDPSASEGWPGAAELGAYGMAPWGQSSVEVPQPEIYCSHKVTSRVLAGMGVPPDFESDATLRYIHRRDGETEIYFVANGTEQRVATDCRFRVAGKNPEIWDPLTGGIKPPVLYHEKDGRTFLPLWLEPAGSVFVVFRKASPDSQNAPHDPVVSGSCDGERIRPAPRIAPHVKRLRPTSTTPAIEMFESPQGEVCLLAWRSGKYELQTTSGKTRRFEVPAIPAALELSGAWEVRFQPGRGAPDKVAIESLIDWSKHTDDGVKHFSGIAKYRKEITVPAELIARNRRVFLDLGKVQVMARVKLNGQDLGVLWKTPFRVDISGAVKSGANSLEVEVANLWPNRLIGDAGLPKEKRVGRTTWNPFKKDTPLLESGLLGPVTLQSADAVVIREE